MGPFPRAAGYSLEGELYCPDCVPQDCDRDEVGVVWGGEEWDYQPHCGVCGEELDIYVVAEDDEDEDEDDNSNIGSALTDEEREWYANLYGKKATD